MLGVWGSCSETQCSGCCGRWEWGGEGRANVGVLSHVTCITPQGLTAHAGFYATGTPCVHTLNELRARGSARTASRQDVISALAQLVSASCHQHLALGALAVNSVPSALTSTAQPVHLSLGRLSKCSKACTPVPRQVVKVLHSLYTCPSADCQSAP